MLTEWERSQEIGVILQKRHDEGEGKEMAFKDKDFSLPLEYEPLTRRWFLYFLPAHQFFGPRVQKPVYEVWEPKCGNWRPKKKLKLKLSKPKTKSIGPSEGWTAVLQKPGVMKFIKVKSEEPTPGEEWS